VSTFTAEKPRRTLSEPQLGHLVLNPAEYSDIEARTSNGFLQSSQVYSYVGTIKSPVADYCETIYL
jgi:hypothetical protein